MYFGLQTGWISMMSLQSSLLGFAIFKAAKPYLKVPFGPAENIVLQSIAVATGTMPLAAGFVGIIPALQMMTTKDNPSGPIHLTATQMILWCLAIAFFGVFIAVPLRTQVIIREKLPFPSGTATAQMIGVLHNTPLVVKEDGQRYGVDDEESTLRQRRTPRPNNRNISSNFDDDDDESAAIHTFLQEDNWRINMTALGVAFTLSGLYTVLSYFLPGIAAIPVFDWLTGMTVTVGGTWQWFLTPSLSYVGQGIIMGFPTTAAMLLGCVVGWGILSPLATLNKWVPGPVSSATDGARGWILWISLGVMIAESIVSLLGVVVLSMVAHYRYKARSQRYAEQRALLEHSGASNEAFEQLDEDTVNDDAPIDQLVPLKVWVCGLILSSFLCLFLIWVVFRDQHMPVYATLLALALGCLLSVLGVRALGSTDLNPVSGIGKVSQFVFAGVVPGGIVANLIAGGIAEAGAQQAGDLMQDLKTGHLMGASPKAQFWGQLIGSLASVFISTGVYKLYSAAYELPGDVFQVPTAHVWLDLARLVNGHSLPDYTVPFILGFAALFAGLTLLTTVYSDVAVLRGSSKPKWLKYVPSGIAFAIGIYNLPNFTLARFAGGVVSVWWDKHCQKYGKDPSAKYARLGRVFLIIIASGFVLGEGTLSIVNLFLKTFGVSPWSCVGCYAGCCKCGA
ncbi:MAG: OPT oligopeptide transporter protein-domain-containing protein [Podila humilis]|nr:MAG: OPT oligopeptide transporter protein-domain-containing protein [Podila humilis]